MALKGLFTTHKLNCLTPVCKLQCKQLQEIHVFRIIIIILHPFNGLFSSTTWVSWYQKGKTSLDLNETRDDGVWGWQLHQLDHMQTICTSLQTDNHHNTSSLNFLQAGCSSWCQTNSGKALKAINNNNLNQQFLMCSNVETITRTDWATTVLVLLQPIKSWCWCAWPMNASRIWLNLLQVSSALFTCCEQALIFHISPIKFQRLTYYINRTIFISLPPVLWQCAYRSNNVTLKHSIMDIIYISIHQQMSCTEQW